MSDKIKEFIVVCDPVSKQDVLKDIMWVTNPSDYALECIGSVSTHKGQHVDMSKLNPTFYHTSAKAEATTDANHRLTKHTGKTADKRITSEPKVQESVGEPATMVVPQSVLIALKAKSEECQSKLMTCYSYADPGRDADIDTIHDEISVLQVLDQHLRYPTEDSIKLAVVFMTTLRTPLIDVVPPEVRKFLTDCCHVRPSLKHYIVKYKK